MAFSDPQQLVFWEAQEETFLSIFACVFLSASLTHGIVSFPSQWGGSKENPNLLT